MKITQKQNNYCGLSLEFITAGVEGAVLRMSFGKTSKPIQKNVYSLIPYKDIVCFQSHLERTIRAVQNERKLEQVEASKRKEKKIVVKKNKK